MSQFPVFETIAILDGIPQNLAFHQARMDNAIEELFKQTSVFNLAEIIQVPERYQNLSKKRNKKLSSSLF